MTVTGTLYSVYACEKNTIEIGHDSTDIASWAMMPFDKTLTAQLQKNPDSDKLVSNHGTILQSGGLLRIFNTVSDGDVLWQGTVDLEHETNIPHGRRRQQVALGMWVHGLQRGMSADQWAAMFVDSLPVKLERKDGTVIFGALSDFFETGTEGVMWAVNDYTKVGYDSLIILKSGDKITVYSQVRDGNVVWQGNLNLQSVPRQQQEHPFKAHTLPAGIPEATWRQATGMRFPAIYTPPAP